MLGFIELGFRGLGFRGLGSSGLGGFIWFRGLGFRGLGSIFNVQTPFSLDFVDTTNFLNIDGDSTFKNFYACPPTL